MRWLLTANSFSEDEKLWPYKDIFSFGKNPSLIDLGLNCARKWQDFTNI